MRLEEKKYSNSHNDSASTIEQLCSWKPSGILAKYQNNKTDISIQKEFFLHVTNYVAQKNWDIEHANITPPG